jgi:putative membrane protein
MRFILRLLINAAALWVATKLVSGITAEADPVTFLAVALVFGLLNALVRPVLKLLSCPLMLLTLGLFTFVINALMLLLTSWIAQGMGLGFRIDGFLPALLGSLIVSLVSFVLSHVLR